MGSGATTAMAELQKPTDAADISGDAARALAEVRLLRALAGGAPARVAALLALTPAERTVHDKAVLVATVKRENVRKKEAEVMARRNDYSSSFSGTADDTKNEAEAAALLKGGDGGGGDESTEDAGEFAILNPLPADLHATQLAALRAHGTWLRFMNPSNSCWSYIHSLTLEITGIRPEGFVDDSTNTEEASVAGESVVAGPLKIKASELPEHIERVGENTKKTLLILDGTASENTGAEEPSPLMSFFAQRGAIADLSGFGMTISQQRKNGFKAKTCVDEARKGVVAALKAGLTCAIFLGEISGDDVSVDEKICKKPLGGPKTFPVTLFEQSGQGMLSNKRYARLYRDEDKDVVGVAFKTVVVSSFDPKSYQRELKSAFQKGLTGFEVVHVVP
jgi:hypothetical protein